MSTSSNQIIRKQLSRLGLQYTTADSGFEWWDLLRYCTSHLIVLPEWMKVRTKTKEGRTWNSGEFSATTKVPGPFWRHDSFMVAASARCCWEALSFGRSCVRIMMPLGILTLTTSEALHQKDEPWIIRTSKCGCDFARQLLLLTNDRTFCI